MVDRLIAFYAGDAITESMHREPEGKVTGRVHLCSIACLDDITKGT